MGCRNPLLCTLKAGLRSPCQEGMPNQRRCLYTLDLSPFARSTSGLIKPWYKWGIWETQPKPICLLSLQVVDGVLLGKTTRH